MIERITARDRLDPSLGHSRVSGRSARMWLGTGLRKVTYSERPKALFQESPLFARKGSERRQNMGLAELQLTFESDKDAQAIYWHFFEGIKGIIL